jgi:hypothetical protein
MKHTIICLILFFSFAQIIAQNGFKAIEKSGKKPDWLNGTDENYIITYGSGPTSEAAKEQCLANIRSNVSSAVAIQVSSKTKIDIQTKNGKTDESFKYAIESQTANIPSLKGISINKAKDYYWEKLKDKSGNILFGYHIKYPFSQSELNDLIDEYNAMDEESSRKIKEFDRMIDTTTSFDRLESAIVEMEALKLRLIDDRKDKIIALLERLKTNSHPYSIKTIKNNAGELSYVLINTNGKSIRVSAKPAFISKCAKLKSLVVEDTLNIINFEYDLCKYVEMPQLKLSYAIANRKFEFSYPIDVNLNKVELSMVSDVVMKSLSQNESNILETECELGLSSKFNYPIKIRAIQLKIDNEPPIVGDNLEYEISKSGAFKINFKSKMPLKKELYSHKNKAFPYVSCLIQYYNVNTQKDGVIHISNQRYSTDW